jgi:nucleotide-binding universal stress UspA family protein
LFLALFYFRVYRFILIGNSLFIPFLVPSLASSNSTSKAIKQRLSLNLSHSLAIVFLRSLTLNPTSLPMDPIPNPSLTSPANRRIGIAVDLSDESAYALRWAVQNYLRPGDSVILLHVRPTSVLYGADWGSVDTSIADQEGSSEEAQQKWEEHFDAFTDSKAQELAQPLVDANIPYKIHVVKDHDMKERLCLEIERLGPNAVIMGSRGFGASRKNSKGRLGSVSDYCVHHCVCPVVVVRCPDDAAAGLSAPAKVFQSDPTNDADAESDVKKGLVFYLCYI